MKPILMLSALVLAAATCAQTSVSKTTGYPDKVGMPRKGLSAQDRKFMTDAAAGNQFEIKSSEVAMRNGRSTFVKKFAKMMIVDHSAAFNELKVDGTKKGVMISKKLPAPLQAKVSMLSKLRGAAFDSAYIKAQKEAHADTAMKFDKEIKTGHDETAKNYAIKTLPTVKMHQKMLATKMVMPM